MDAIRTSIKVPFLESSFKEPHFIQIAETEYVNPENEQDVIKIKICVPNVSFNEAKLRVTIHK